VKDNAKYILISYVFTVFFIGLSLSCCVIFKFKDISILGVVLFGILIFAADNFSVPLPKAGFVSVNLGISLASLILFGPSTAILVTLISSISIRDILKKEPYYKHIFNCGQYLVAISSASWVFGIFFDKNINNIFSPKNVGVIFLSSIIFFILNTFLTAAVISISDHIKVFNVWIFNFAWLFPFHIFLTVMALAISFLYNLYGPFTLLLTMMPLIIAQYTYMLRMNERKALLNSIMHIVKIVEAKDIYTAGHSVRVAEYSERIARKLKLSEYDIDTLKNLANLHDIGKIQVELSVLNKLGTLNSDDWNEIKKHPIVGYEIVKEITFLKDNAVAILYHHERYDGNGYPFGISKDRIPMFAKIISIADAYDAMTTDRPYRRALSKEEALSELKKNLNKQFDGIVCMKMIEILEAEMLMEAYSLDLRENLSLIS
jgi:putative nucleotidyltransferase with HDIG domain